jgi:hypothetical protein
MEKNLAKSLTDLIDETLAEIEALKKSDRFAPETIEMDHDADGSTDTKPVHKADDEDEEDRDDEDEEEHDDEAKKAEEAYKKAEEECEKAEKALKDAMSKKDMCKAEHDKHMAKKEHEEAHKAEGVNELAKAEDKKAKKIKKMEKKLAKSLEARVAPLESQIAQVLEAVKKFGDAPVPARGMTYKNVQPLAKGAAEVEPLSKSQVLSDLVTLKKSGKEVSIEDVLKAEIGNDTELHQIATKYGIK